MAKCKAGKAFALTLELSEVSCNYKKELLNKELNWFKIKVTCLFKTYESNLPNSINQIME